MSAIAATLRATLRLHGTLLFWCFYGLLLTLAVLLLVSAPDPRSTLAPAAVLGFGSCLGWMLFLGRLWQLQQHAESLQLPGARRDVERTTFLLVVLGSGLPTVLLSLLGVSPGWSLLTQWLALSSVLVYLMVTPMVGVLLVVGLSVLPLFAGKWLRLLVPDAESAFFPLWGLVALLLAVGVPRWRRLLRRAPATGWNAPQVVAMAERGLAGSRVQSDDPSLQWMDLGEARIGAKVGPHTPRRALSIFLCGPLASLGWRNYLRNSGWMLLVIGLLVLLMLAPGSDRTPRMPSGALVALLTAWSLVVPLTVITRLRQLWHDEGHGLAEAALLPGLARGGGDWRVLAGVVLYTTAYRLALPALLIALLLAIGANDPSAPLLPVLICVWSVATICTLLPLARRRGGLPAFLLYAGVATILLGVLVAQFLVTGQGSGVLWRVLLPCSLPVLTLAVAGWRLPVVGRPLVQP